MEKDGLSWGKVCEYVEGNSRYLILLRTFKIWAVAFLSLQAPLYFLEQSKGIKIRIARSGGENLLEYTERGVMKRHPWSIQRL